MIHNLKVKVSLWYAFLFTILLASTLLASYKIISIQLKNEILNDLKVKVDFINNTINQKDSHEHSHKETGEHHGENEEEHENKNEANYSLFDQIFNSNFPHVRMATEISDDNYLMFIYHNNSLIYLTEKYHHLESFLPSQGSLESKIIDQEIGEVSFSLTSIQAKDFNIFIAYNLTTLSNLQSKIFNIFLIIFPISLVLSIICGFVVTQRTMNVINRINETAKRITSSNLSKRIEAPQGTDEIAQLIDTLNKMISRLEKSFTQSKQFSQDAAHEIRTPLTIIRGEIEDLIEGNSSHKDSVATLESILEEVQYLSSISDRLLLIHNMDTNNIKYNFEKINISELIEEIYQDVLVLSSNSNVKVHLDMSKNIEISGNKELISRLMWNLSDNAIKYNTKHGSLIISLQSNSVFSIIKVSDTGIGIPKTDLNKIFDRFYRVDKSRSRRLGGSGLGLSICKWIVELHNGTIDVESILNKGTTFTIKIPKLNT